jgi:hypothetical protein
LIMMTFWLVRIRLGNRFKREAIASAPHTARARAIVAGTVA